MPRGSPVTGTQLGGSAVGPPVTAPVIAPRLVEIHNLNKCQYFIIFHYYHCYYNGLKKLMQYKTYKINRNLSVVDNIST